MLAQKKRISRCCKDQQSQRSYFPDAAAIERAAKKIAKEETDGERPSPSMLDAIVKQVQTFPDLPGKGTMCM